MAKQSNIYDLVERAAARLATPRLELWQAAIKALIVGELRALNLEILIDPKVYPAMTFKVWLGGFRDSVDRYNDPNRCVKILRRIIVLESDFKTWLRNKKKARVGRILIVQATSPPIAGCFAASKSSLIMATLEALMVLPLYWHTNRRSPVRVPLKAEPYVSPHVPGENTPDRVKTPGPAETSLITPLVHVKGYTVPETKAAIEQARLLIEQAEALGEPPEDPLLLFSVLYGVFISSVGAFDGDVLRDVTAHILELAERQAASFPRVIGHNFVAFSSMLSGELADARAHFDQAIALYDPDVHRHLGTRFGEDQNVPSLTYRGWACGFSAIPRPRSATPIAPSRTPERSGKPQP